MIAAVMIVELASVNASAQTSAVNGAIAGTVRDPSRLVIPDAQVTATSIESGFTRQSQTDSTGSYTIPLLPLGAYSLSVSKTGFTKYVQTGVTVQAERVTTLDISLGISSSNETVSVQADAPTVSTESQTEFYLSKESVENLPLTSRNLFNYATFTPAIATTQTNSFGTPGISFGGILRRNFVVDGLDDTQRAGQSKLVMFPAGSMQEVSILQGALLPEYGSTLGGLVFENSKAGTNQYHGSVMDLERRPGLIAKPSLAKKKPFQERATREVTFGGPILLNKWWGFADIELDPQTSPSPITITAANAAALSIPPSDLGSAPVVSKYKMWLARTDFQLSDKSSGFVRLDYFGVPIQYNGNNALFPLSADLNYYDQDISGVAQLQKIFSARALNEFRFADNRRFNHQPPVNGKVGPVYSIPGVATFNSNATANNGFFEHQDEFVDNFSLTQGAHSMKFGATFETVNNTLTDRLAQTFTFGAPGTDPATGLPNSVIQFLNTANGITPTGYTLLTQQFGDNTAHFRDNYMSLYAQDQWRIRSNLQFTYGLRYDLISYASLDPLAPIAESRSVPSDKRNFSPRVGFSWQPEPKTSLRGGYSILYDFTDLQFVGTTLRSNGHKVLTYTIAGSAPGAPTFPRGFTQVPTIPSIVTNVAGFSPDFKTYYSHQADLIVDRDLSAGFGIQAGYMLYLGERAPVFQDANLGAPTGTLADGRPIFGGPRHNPNFSQVQLVQSVGSSSYHGGFLALTKRLTKDFEFATSYTYSHAINNNDGATDTLGSANGLPSAPGNLDFDRGRSSGDMRHRFTFQGVWQPTVRTTPVMGAIVNGWRISPAVVLNSGLPVNVIAGTDLNKDGLLNDRPVGVGRNSITGPGYKQVDLRVGRTFPLFDKVTLEAIAQAENLLNSTNASCNLNGCTGAVVNTSGASNFLTVTSAFPSRQLELGGRIRF